jgi:regulator of protease activity HflC (stomatin/prohibitin superfamily)
MLPVVAGVILWFLVRYLVMGFYTVEQNERAVLTSFGKGVVKDSQPNWSDKSNETKFSEENCPKLKVIGPGFHFKLPWQQVYKESIATRTVSLGFDPENSSANSNGTILEAVTKDNLHIGLRGQIRYRIDENYLFAYFFGVKNPLTHVMGYFVSVLRERVANFEAKRKSVAGDVDDINNVIGISINDLRKNLTDLNDIMSRECLESAERYGIILEASLITEIDPPREVESALAAINTAHNNVSSSISLAQAEADQKLMQSRKAVEIEVLKAKAEVEPFLALARELRSIAGQGTKASLQAFVRFERLKLFRRAKRVLRSI